MEVLRDGTFIFTIGSEELSLGLRPTKRAPRNSKFMVKCEGAVGLDNVLQVIDDLEDVRLSSEAVITDGFPYPQIFVFTEVIIVCGKTDIYEYDGTLNHMLGPVDEGYLWTAADFYDFVYMSNGEVAVVRDSVTGIYSITADQPTASSICNFKGQVVIGDPFEE